MFPFLVLDMKMIWNESKIIYEVYSKENQRIKYVNRTSIHREILFQAIPKGVFHSPSEKLKLL